MNQNGGAYPAGYDPNFVGEWYDKVSETHPAVSLLT